MKTHEIIRLQYIKRWAIVHTSRPQSVAEHSYNVAILAWDLCQRLNLNPHIALGMALLHDIDEVETGDIPATFKRKLSPGSQELLHRHYHMALEDFGIPSDELSEAVVKSADVIEAAYYLYNHASGSHSARVWIQTTENLERDLKIIGENDPQLVTHALNLWDELREQNLPSVG
jgi:putative nucleotidyltransferase with HDIG domain